MTCCSDLYRRYAEEAGWMDVCKMLITFEWYVRLLMNKMTDQTEKEFEEYISADISSFMPIGTSLPI
jgi:hypothetical protein